MDLELNCERLWDRNFARDVDRQSSEHFFLHPLVLMEAAGEAVANHVRDSAEDDDTILVVAGSGNNGGDALVAGRRLADMGFEVHFFLVSNETSSPLSESCARQVKTLTAIGHELSPYKPGIFERFRKSEPIVIDGVFGLGFRGPLSKESLSYRALQELDTLRDKTVFAVDLPSGLDADSGEAQETPLKADVTVTFGGMKPVHVLAPARDACGMVMVSDIGFPLAAAEAAAAEHPAQYALADPLTLVAQSPWDALPKSANKYDRGHVLVIGGSAGKTGAPLLAALAALRAGAGWASVSMPKEARDTLKGEVPREITFEELFQGDELDAQRLERFLKERRVNAVVLGCGMMSQALRPETRRVLADFTSKLDGFVVLDAGATHGLEEALKGARLDPDLWLATPHPGEWRKMGPGFAEISPLTPDGLAKAKSLVQSLGISVMYKHATPVIVTGDKQAPALVTDQGSRALARAGSGDVLSGVIAAHGAIGLSAVTAGLRSQVIVAGAARLAAADKGEHAVLAHDVIERLGDVDTLLFEEDESADDQDYR